MQLTELGWVKLSSKASWRILFYNKWPNNICMGFGRSIHWIPIYNWIAMGRLHINCITHTTEWLLVLFVYANQSINRKELNKVKKPYPVLLGLKRIGLKSYQTMQSKHFWRIAMFFLFQFLFKLCIYYFVPTKIWEIPRISFFNYCFMWMIFAIYTFFYFALRAEVKDIYLPLLWFYFNTAFI